MHCVSQQALNTLWKKVVHLLVQETVTEMITTKMLINSGLT